MALLASILTIVLPVFIVIILGYSVKRLRLVDAGFLFQLNRLIFYLALPSLLFYKIATADFKESFNVSSVLGYGIAVIAMLLLSYGFAVLRGYGDDVRGVFSQCSFRGNLAYIGLAITFNAYGEAGLATAGVLCGFIIPFINFLSIVVLLLPFRGGKVGKMYFLKQLAGNPMIIGSLAGVLWSFFAIPMPLILDKVLHIITGMALPLALISIGASFSLQRMKGDLVLAAGASTFKLLLNPLVTGCFMYLCGARGVDLSVGVLCAATPAATASFIMTQQIKGDAELAGTIIMLSTLFSALTYLIILFGLKSFGL